MLASYIYGLQAVAVLRGTIAFAGGANPLTGTTGLSTQGQVGVTNALATSYLNANGVIIATVNGGFSWVVQARCCALPACWLATLHGSKPCRADQLSVSSCFGFT